MKSFFFIALALFFSSPSVVEAHARESVGMCVLKAKSRYAREMEEIAKEPNPEMLKVLTQDALVRKFENIDGCQQKLVAKKQTEIQPKKANRQPAEEEWSCAMDVECQNGKIEAMGFGAE